MTIELLLYLIKANLIITGLWLLCRLLLVRDIGFRRKRLIINYGIALAMILPLLSAIPSTNDYALLADSLTLQAIPQAIGPTTEILISTNSETVPHINYTLLFFASYVVVVGILLIRTVVRIISLIALSNRCHKQKYRGFTIYRIPDSSSGPFSFFRSIYIGEYVDLTNSMLRHEAAHISQYHSVDILLTELLVDLLWINPAAWLLRSESSDNLEFLADESALKSNDRREYQLSLLNTTLSLYSAPLGTNFNVSSIKRRITMINRISTTSRGRWIYAIVLPVLLLAVAVGCVRSVSSSDNASTDVVTTTPETADNQKESETQEINPSATPQPRESTAMTDVQPTSKNSEPTFPKGDFLTFLGKNVVFPESAVNDSINGTVIITFTIDSEGNLINPRVTQSVRQDVDEAALAAVKKSPKWHPSSDGHPQEFNIPISFRAHPLTKPAPGGR